MRELLLAIVFGSAAIGIALRFNLHYQHGFISVLVEAFLIFLAAWVIFRNHDVKRIARSISVPHQIFAALIIAGLVMGQLSGKGRVLFPFTHWEMYGRVPHGRFESLEKGYVDRIQFAAKTESGQEFEFPINSVTPSLSRGRLGQPVTLWVLEYQRAQTEEDKAFAISKAKGKLAPAIRIYNRLHDEDPIISVGVSSYKCELKPRAERSVFDKNFLFEVLPRE